MLLRQVLEIVDLVADRPDACGEAVARLLRSRGAADVLGAAGGRASREAAARGTAPTLCG